MSDRISYIQAGVKHAWMAVYNTGEVVKEFSQSGFITKLKEVEWDRVVEFCAYDIADSSEEPIPLVRFPFASGNKPIWFHRSTAYLGDNGRISPDPVIDFIGVETESSKTYCCFESDGSIRILIE